MSRFTIVDVPQRSEAWYRARAGRATGSKADCILAQGKKPGQEAITRRDYRLRLACEILTGMPQEDDFQSREMQHGIEKEPLALAMHEARSGLFLRRTGFVSMNEVPAGCSPDSDADDFTGIVAVKCPKTATHIEYIRAARVPPEYVPECRHDLWVTGAQWVDFVSFDDRLPEHLQYFCVRAYRSEFDVPGYEKELMRFLAEVAISVRELKELRVA